MTLPIIPIISRILLTKKGTLIPHLNAIQTLTSREQKIVTPAQPDEEMLDFLDLEEVFSKHLEPHIANYSV